jgi:hypothetical protein
MLIVCKKCNFEFERKDKALNEEYLNIYGTICPNCKNRIDPNVQNKIIEQNDIKRQILIEIMRKKMRENFLK